MKLKESILISILLLAPLLSRACGPYGWQAADYMLPRIWDPAQSGNTEDDRRLLHDWQEIAGTPSIRLEDISNVVFNYSVERLDGIGPREHIENGFEKYLADNDFAALKGEELKAAMKEYISHKDADLKGQMVSQGTTPRKITDLIGSLCDLTSGSGDKGTPVVLVQGYFDNYTN